ncbi:hypothetical protein [Lactiplantibacillus plantarum]|uniref:hypothetical protein n=1 Tax=Lactiplantibacillus plantarum TaxID=1590 RepID=UPI001BA62952|nr:hypothetical protein [Lactiplantibacillus plantarum]MBS0955633.1 hypothetical protein [Lactiplantibacillus plantarum]
MFKFLKFYVEFKRESKVVVVRHKVEYPDSFKPSMKLVLTCYRNGYTGSDAASILF